MFSINHNSSCISLGFTEKIPVSTILIGINAVLGLQKTEQKVIITTDYLDNPEVFNNALLYLDIEMKTKGIRVFITICSVTIHQTIKNWKSFLLSLAKELKTDIFIESEEKGYLIKIKGTIKEIEYEEVYDDKEGWLIFYQKK